tara:strand:+ start:513 stop:797 length:285 start_codon:yes stop_codon:yes gene_type:complete
MSDKTLDDIIFNSDLYKEAQSNFLKKGIEGSINDMLGTLGDSFRYPNSKSHKDTLPLRNEIAKCIAQRMLFDLREGLINNDIQNIDINKLDSKN